MERDVKRINSRVDWSQTTVTAVAISKDGNSIVSGSLDGTLRIWNVNAGKEIRTSKEDDLVLGVYISKNGTVVGAFGDSWLLFRINEKATAKVTLSHSIRLFIEFFLDLFFVEALILLRGQTVSRIE
ncbi:hypothetical protein HK098_007400 [Nowakowskiella sp. JEL0407]|nr:hypothetical protein HK098_007400 [Nowakowskiella sp. JEL0407]